MKVFLCKYKEREENEIDYEDDSGPIYYDNEEQLLKFDLKDPKKDVASINLENKDEKIEKNLAARMTPIENFI